jgi:16S rRNA (cytidine1402-2'-O)-methyltransferase
MHDPQAAHLAGGSPLAHKEAKERRKTMRDEGMANGTGEGGRTFRLHNAVIPARPLEPALYLVATPIGNLSDITLRALETLAGADVLACEDTRVTRVLLDRYGIVNRPYAYHEHNADEAGPRLISALEAGKSVALVSDAGTPLVSDPGYRLALLAIAAGHRVVPIPGASAPLAALVGSGLPNDAFFFAGFLPTKDKARRDRLAELSAVPATLLFFESPHRIAATVTAAADVLGEGRAACVCRELTKTFEEFRRGEGAVGQGLGLGLAIADRIARLIDAPLRLRSRLGYGTVFALSLPTIPAPRQDATPVAGGLEGLRILIVDNDPQALAALRGVLASWGCRVDAFADGAGAEALLADGEEPALWLFDYHLDDGDTGVALQARLAQRFGARPTLILSADDSGDVRRVTLEHGLGLLPKPVKALALKSMLRRLLAARAA